MDFERRTIGRGKIDTDDFGFPGDDKLLQMKRTISAKGFRCLAFFFVKPFLG